MSFRLVPKSVTLVVILRYFSETGSIRGALRKVWLKIFPNFLQEKYSPTLLVFSDISLTIHDVGNPSVGGLNARGVAKYSDFGPIEGYISETVQDRR